MRRPRSTAAIRTLELWKELPRSARAHTTLRWWTAPFEELQILIPASGDVLEIGCGHGVFSTFVALSSPDRLVLGIDIDAEKIDLARTSIDGLRPDEASVRFECRPSGDIPSIDGGWDAIVFADVLYLLHPDDRARLLDRCVELLAPQGVLVVKEVDTEPRFKAWIAQLQEFLATRVLRITRGDRLDFPSIAELESQMEKGGLQTRVARLDKGYFHPHCVVVGERNRRQKSVGG